MALDTTRRFLKIKYPVLSPPLDIATAKSTYFRPQPRPIVDQSIIVRRGWLKDNNKNKKGASLHSPQSA